MATFLPLEIHTLILMKNTHFPFNITCSLWEKQKYLYVFLHNYCPKKTKCTPKFYLKIFKLFGSKVSTDKINEIVINGIYIFSKVTCAFKKG